VIRELLMTGDCRVGDFVGDSSLNHQSPITNRQPFTNHRSLITIVTLFVSVFSAVAQAAETRFQHVSLLNARDRVSLVFELTGEPQNVATRRVSGAVLELDAGPVVMPARATSFMAPAGTRFVMGVSIQGGEATAGRLKARITLLERARTAVRVVGRRVYVDFSLDTPPATQGAEPGAAFVPPPPKAPARLAEAEREGGTSAQARLTRRAPQETARAVTPAAPTPAAPVPPSTSGRDAYRSTIQPAIDRFDELKPFLLSAAASPSEPVLKAVGSTLVGIQGLLLSVDVPAESRRAHDVLSSAVAAAVTAVSPTFGGDRAAQAKQALGLLEQARAGW
jgi:hypothetical protein